MKVGIFTSNANFLAPILESLKRNGHEPLFWTRTPNESVNWANLQRLLDRCDVAFFEWCQQPFLEALSLEGLDCKVAVRAHGIPFFSIYKTFPWKRVDLLIGASGLFGPMLNEAAQRPKRYIDIPVGSDPTLYTMPRSRKYGQNLVTHSFVVRFKKRIYTTIQTYYDLLQHDKKWNLHIVGNWEGGSTGWEGANYTTPCWELMEDLGISTKVFMTPNMDPEGWHQYLCDKDIFLSNSIREGVHISLVEAMFTGVYPLINCWRGAREYYPEECIFKTQSELVDKVLEWEKRPVKEKRRLSREMREWASERFDGRPLADKVVEALETL